jgi:hypothetical protein
MISQTSHPTGGSGLTSSLAAYAAVIRAAKNGEYFEDFRTNGRLAHDFQLGYELRMHSLNELILQGVVSLENSRLVLGHLETVEWLTTALLEGQPEAWQICDAFGPLGRKFEPDQLALEMLGLEGEEHVLRSLHEDLPLDKHREVVQVSLTDDTAGYDIRTPTTLFPDNVFLEIKTSSRPGDKFSFFLSRNEWNVAKTSSRWYLVLVKKSDRELSIFGHLDAGSLVGYFPEDSHPDFTWTVAKGSLTTDDVFPGLPGF